MKKTISVLALLASLVLIGLNTSCTKTKTKEYEELIVGVWQLDSHELWEFTNGGSVVIHFNGQVIGTTAYTINNNILIFHEGWLDGHEWEEESLIIINLSSTYLELESQDNGMRYVLRRYS